MKKYISAFIATIIIFTYCIPAFAANAQYSNKPATENQSFPAAFSAVEKGYVTYPKQQGYSGCCWAFAAISCLETDAIMKGYESNPNFSEAHLVWSVFSGSGIDGDTNKDEKVLSNGNSIYSCACDYGSITNALAKGCGINNESDYPFYPFDINKMGNYPNSAYYSNNGYAIEGTAVINSPEGIKAWLLEHGSAAALIYAGDGAHYSKTSSTTAYYSGPDCTNDVNHGIAIVGWNDNYDASNFKIRPEHNGAWLCKNSWGSEWGNNGYFWLSYDEVSLTTVYGFSIKRADFDKVYTYNGVTFSSMVSISKNLSYANVFDVAETEELECLSFYTFENNSVNIRIVKLNGNYASPEDGTIIYNKAYTYSENGYQTVPVSNVTLNSGSYSVIIDLSGPRCVCAAEAGAESYCQYTASTGQSFLKYNNTWHDSYKNGNLYINMYTSVVNEPTVTPNIIKEEKQTVHEEVVETVTVQKETTTIEEVVENKTEEVTDGRKDEVPTTNETVIPEHDTAETEANEDVSFWARIISFFAIIASVIASVFKTLASFF